MMEKLVVALIINEMSDISMNGLKGFQLVYNLYKI